MHWPFVDNIRVMQGMLKIDPVILYFIELRKVRVKLLGVGELMNNKDGD